MLLANLPITFLYFWRRATLKIGYVCAIRILAAIVDALINYFFSSHIYNFIIVLVIINVYDH